MKTLFFVLAAIFISFGLFAQSDTTMNKMKHDKMPMHDKMQMLKKDGCMMMDGKMMMIKDGKMTAMKKQMTLGNGTKCMVDRTCVKKDGSKINMKEGDHMDMDGNMKSMKKEHEGDM